MALGYDGYNVEFSENGNEVLERVADKPDVSLILLDLLMPYKDGFETLEELRRIRPEVPVIVLSGASSAVNIVSATKRGAVDFLPKPVSPRGSFQCYPEGAAIRSGGSASRLERAVYADCRSVESKTRGCLLSRIGTSDVPVLLQGETGVGKEVLARKLHARSARAGNPFLKLNCAALPSELVESEYIWLRARCIYRRIQEHSREIRDGERGQHPAGRNRRHGHQAASKASSGRPGS